MPDSEAGSSTAHADENSERPPGTSSPDGSWLASDRVQALANVLTILVALCAISLSVWQGYETRMQNRLSVIPNLESFEATMGSATPIESKYFFLPSRRDSLFAIGYGVENTGLGPAVLHNILEYEGEEKVFDAVESGRDYYPSGYKEELAALSFPARTVNDMFSVGQMLQADQVHHLITVILPFPTEGERYGEKYRDSLRRHPMRVMQENALEKRTTVFCYCSVYEEHCGQTSLGADPPVEDACGF